jgi:hypothetical protein
MVTRRPGRRANGPGHSRGRSVDVEGLTAPIHHRAPIARPCPDSPRVQHEGSAAVSRTRDSPQAPRLPGHRRTKRRLPLRQSRRYRRPCSSRNLSLADDDDGRTRRRVEDVVIEVAKDAKSQPRFVRLATWIRRVFGRPSRSERVAPLYRYPRRASSDTNISGGVYDISEEIRRAVRRTVRLGLIESGFQSSLRPFKTWAVGPGWNGVSLRLLAGYGPFMILRAQNPRSVQPRPIQRHRPLEDETRRQLSSAGRRRHLHLPSVRRRDQ